MLNFRIPEHVKKILKMSKNHKKFEKMQKNHEKFEKIFRIILNILKKNHKEWNKITMLKYTFTIRIDNVIFQVMKIF